MSSIPLSAPQVNKAQVIQNTAAATMANSKNLPNLMGLGTDYAITNKFVMYIPIQNVLGPEFKALEL